MKKFISFVIILSMLGSCSYRPIFNPNQKFISSGQEKADADFKVCKKKADDYLDQYKARRAAKEAARKAAVGGVVGAVTGAVFGRTLKSSLIGTAIGASVGAVSGAISVAGEDKISPDQMKQRYITQCLANDGYEILGWE